MLATKKDYYDLLVRSALDGTMPSYDIERDKCFYRDGKGHKCAIGVGIPDEEYRERMEAFGASNLFDEVYELFPKDIEECDFILIQEAHDESSRDALGAIVAGYDTYRLVFAETFVERLNELDYFRSVTQVDPRTFSAASLSNVTSPAM